MILKKQILSFSGRTLHPVAERPTVRSTRRPHLMTFASFPPTTIQQCRWPTSNRRRRLRTQRSTAITTAASEASIRIWSVKRRQCPTAKTRWRRQSRDHSPTTTLATTMKKITITSKTKYREGKVGSTDRERVRSRIYCPYHLDRPTKSF